MNTTESNNPYELIYYKHDWSNEKTKENNAKFWEWEIKYNGFVPANSKIPTNENKSA